MQVSVNGEVPEEKIVFAHIAKWCVISGPPHWPVANGDLTFHIAGSSFTPEVRFSLGRIKAGVVATGILLALFLSAHVLVAPALAEPMEAAGYAVESVSLSVEDALLGVFDPQMAPDAPEDIAVTVESPTPEAGAPTEIPAPTETPSPTATQIPTVAKPTIIPSETPTKPRPVAAPIVKPTATIVPTVAPTAAPAAPVTVGTTNEPPEQTGQGKEPPGQSKEPPGQEKNQEKPNPPSPPGQAKEPPGQGKK